MKPGTPGPWKMDGTFVRDKQGTAIGTVILTRRLSDPKTEELDANAYNIRHAWLLPEIVEILRETLSFMPNSSGYDGIRNKVWAILTKLKEPAE